MEALLFILFVIFSLVSSYMERRKRRREVELARESQNQRAERQEQELDLEGYDEWMSDLDPFSDKKANPMVEEKGFGVGTYPSEELKLPNSEFEEEKFERIDQEEDASPKIRSLVNEKKGLSVSEGFRRSIRSTSKNLYKIDARKAREALVYAEIIGPPISERDK